MLNTDFNGLDVLFQGDDSPSKFEKFDHAVRVIREEAPADYELMFQHWLFCDVGLPRKMVSIGPFQRSSSASWISVSAGACAQDQSSSCVIPYGPMARLVLIWITTMAVRTRRAKVEFPSGGLFLRQMGYDCQGARYSKLRQQMEALSKCSMEVGMHNENSFSRPYNLMVEFSSDSLQQWTGSVLLSDEYFNDLLVSCVPLDARALKALRGSALALDIYTWLAGVMLRFGGKNELEYSWDVLRRHFGIEYSGAHGNAEFKKAFRSTLSDVLMVSPTANALISTSGVKIRPPTSPRGHPRPSSALS